VFKARDRRDGKTVAIKIVPVEVDISDLMMEIGILEKCHHKNIVEYRGSYQKDGNVWVSPLNIERGSLLIVHNADCIGVLQRWIVG
jgi:serine/threonine protein kinase